MQMEGRVAYITGGARGQGATLARTFAREGADIVLLDACEQIPTVHYELPARAELDAVAEEIRGLGRRCVAAVADVRDQAQIDAVTERALAELGRIDVVCPNAGIQSTAPFWRMPEEQWHDVIDVNLSGVWRTAKSTAEALIESGGSLVLTASINGHEPLPDYCHYTAAKHGVLGLLKSFAFELGPHGVRVNAVSPGPVRTTMIDNAVDRDRTVGRAGATMDEMHDAIGHWTLLRDTGSLPAQAIADAVLWLTSPGAAHVHGSELVIDAGHSVLPGHNHAPVRTGR